MNFVLTAALLFAFAHNYVDRHHEYPVSVKAEYVALTAVNWTKQANLSILNSIGLKPKGGSPENATKPHHGKCGTSYRCIAAVEIYFLLCPAGRVACQVASNPVGAFVLPNITSFNLAITNIFCSFALGWTYSLCSGQIKYFQKRLLWKRKKP